MKAYCPLLLSGVLIRVFPVFHLMKKKKVLWFKKKFENILYSSFLILQMNKWRPEETKRIKVESSLGSIEQDHLSKAL